MWAAQTGKIQTVQWLCDAKADVELKDKVRMSASNLFMSNVDAFVSFICCEWDLMEYVFTLFDDVLY